MTCACHDMVVYGTHSSECLCQCHVIEELVRLAIKSRDYIAKTDGYNDGNFFENRFMNELEDAIAQFKPRQYKRKPTPDEQERNLGGFNRAEPTNG